MIRVPKQVAVLLVGMAMISAGCSVAGATPSSSPTAAAADPNSILIAAITKAPSVKSFHVSSTVDGTVKLAALTAMMGRTSSLNGDLNLNGTTATADVDVAARAVHATLSVPSFATNADLIVLDRVVYYRISLVGSKYHVIDLSGLPRHSMTASPNMSRFFQGLLEARQKFEAAGGKITFAGTDQVDGRNAEHLAFTIPVAFINGKIAAHESAAAAQGAMAMGTFPPFKLDSASFDAWFYSDSGLLAKTEVKASSSELGNVDTVSTFTGYDQPVTVKAPSAAEIQIGQPSMPVSSLLP